MKSPYETIGVNPAATGDEIRAAYRARVAECHPDRNPGFTEEAHRRTAELNRAYEILRDPVRRAAYDREPHDATAEIPPALAHGDLAQPHGPHDHAPTFRRTPISAARAALR